MISLRLSNHLRPFLTTSSIYLNRLQQLHRTKPNQAVKHVRNENCYFKKIYSDDLQFQRLEPLINSKRIVEDEKLSSFDNLVNTTEISNNKLIPFFREFTNSLKNKDVDSLIFVLNRLRESKFKIMNTTIHHLISVIDESKRSLISNMK